MKSALYSGWIQHRRFGPAQNRFRYRIFMSYLDLAELPGLFDRHWFWSARRPALAWFRRKDFLGPAQLPLDQAVRDLVQQRTGVQPAGPIRLLTHLRFFGYSFNPVSFYYVFDANDTRVETIVAEITNTPWKERHAYVLPVASAVRGTSRAWRFSFEKQFHVSPFMPMDMRYEWCFGAPSQGLHVHMKNWRESEARFDATLNLRRQPMNARSLSLALLQFPLITGKVSALIYWQALSKSLAKSTNLKIFHLEDIGPHYTRTLRLWRERFLEHRAKVRELGYSNSFVRLWEYYLCYCEGGFTERQLGTVQMLLTKPRFRGGVAGSQSGASG